MKTLISKSQRGFSLLELMVASAVGLIAVMAMTQLFQMGMNATLTVTQRAETQENMRAAIELMTKDIGMAGAKVLQQSWTGERVLEVDGPKGGTDLYETAAAFGRALGREVKAVQLPEAAWQNVLEGMGTPADRTGLYIEMVKSFNSGWIHFGNSGTERFPRADHDRGARTRTGQVRRTGAGHLRCRENELEIRHRGSGVQLPRSAFLRTYRPKLQRVCGR